MAIQKLASRNKALLIPTTASIDSRSLRMTRLSRNFFDVTIFRILLLPVAALGVSTSNSKGSCAVVSSLLESLPSHGDSLFGTGNGCRSRSSGPHAPQSFNHVTRRYQRSTTCQLAGTLIAAKLCLRMDIPVRRLYTSHTPRSQTLSIMDQRLKPTSSCNGRHT